MTFRQWVGIFFMMLCASLLGGYAQKTENRVTHPLKIETVYERVMRTQTIRCGYGQWPPFISKDIKTGQFSGIFYDYMEALGKSLSLKIEWTEELGHGDFALAMKSHRIDATCGSVWANAARAREMDFVTPVYYTPLYAYVRKDDHRFDNNLESINTPSVSIVTMDGEMAGLIADTDFPLARKLAVPQLSSVSEFFVNITMKKADVTFTSPSMFDLYEAHNSGKIRKIPSSRPIRVFPNTIAITTGEDKLQRMLDTATKELLANGAIKKILEKYRPHTDGFLEVSTPYSQK